MMMDWERQALYFAAVNAVNAFENGAENVEMLKSVIQQLITELGGTRKVETMQPGAAALYITALYLRKVSEP